jgi:hypothetical protein
MAPNSYHVKKRPHNVVVGLPLITWTGNLVGLLTYAGLEKLAPNHMEKRQHNVVVGLPLITWTGDLVG